MLSDACELKTQGKVKKMFPMPFFSWQTDRMFFLLLLTFYLRFEIFTLSIFMQCTSIQNTS